MSVYDDHGNNCKRHRMDIMDDYLASIGYRRKPIPKDGSSLFRAFSEQMFSTQAHHLYIRESCVRYMKRNQHIFENFVDDSFDDYLARMNNPKEWADQLEISALSKMYRCDFYIYEQPGQHAKNVTENDYKKEVLLCHSGQKHYDNVYPTSYFESYGICQSILASILFERVLGMSKNSLDKCVDTFRMLSCSSTSSDEEKEYEDPEPPLSPRMFFPPSIGILVEGIDPANQSGLAYKFPLSLDAVRSLDPSLYRNVDYDFWLTIKRKQQCVDFAISEGMQYFIGDRCLISLSIYSKPLVGHVQEVSPENGPITVFIEALGGRHSVSVKNVKPLEPFNNGCKSDTWPCRQRRKSHSDWSSRNGGSRRSGYRSKHYSDTLPVQITGDLNFNPKHHLEFVALQQKKMRNGVVGGYASNGSQPRPNSLNLESEIADSGKLYSDECFSPQHSKSQMRETCQWPQANCYSPTTMFQNMSLNQHQYVEENWPDNNNCVEFVEGNPMTSPVEVYSHPCERNLQWNQQQTPQNEVYQNNRYYSQHENQDTREVIEQSELQFSEHNIGSESQQEKVENSAVKSQSLASNNSCSSDQESAQFEQQNAETFHSPAEYAEFNPQQSDNHKPVENNGASQYPHTQHPYNAPAADQNCLQDNMYAPSNYVMPHAPPQYIAPNLSSFHNSVGPNVQPRGSFLPYQATVTMFDTEGNDMQVTDDKNHFNYFFNLGLEYYRHIRSNQPMSPRPVYFGPRSPSSAYSSPVHPGPVMLPQPVSYLPPTPAPRYIPAPVHPQHHVIPNGTCMSVPHFHQMFPSMPPSYPQGRFLVHVPPAQQFQPQPLAQETCDNGNPDVPATTTTATSVGLLSPEVMDAHLPPPVFTSSSSPPIAIYSGNLQPVPNPYIHNYCPPPTHNFPPAYGSTATRAPVYAAPTTVSATRAQFPAA